MTNSDTTRLTRDQVIPVIERLGRVSDYGWNFSELALMALISELEDLVLTEKNKGKVLFWYRPRSDGGHEGPIHNDAIEDSRKNSGAWKPLFSHAPANDEAARGLVEALQGCLEHMEWGTPEGRTAYNEAVQKLAAYKEATR